MTSRKYAFLAGLIGSAVTAWWWNRNRGVRLSGGAHQRGTVIFDNTPSASPLSGDIA
jgi:hypothetical protein